MAEGWRMEGDSMKERALICTDDAIRNILAGIKTQERRIIKPQPTWTEAPTLWSKKWISPGSDDWRICPYGLAGDRLLVRETYTLQSDCDCDQPPFGDGRPVRRWVDPDSGNRWSQPHYRATDPAPDLCCESPRCRCCREGGPGPHWKSAASMPRWASRITLELS